MPIYLGKKASELHIPSGTVTEVGDTLSEVDGADFLQDPEEHRDFLPQPFRLINKMVGKLFDDIWDHIVAREEEHETEMQRILPPKSDLPLLVQGFSNNVTALCGTKDGRFIIVGMKNGLAVVDAVTMATLDLWEYPNLDTVSPLKVEMFSGNSYLIGVRDDMGGARLFVVMESRLYLLKTLYDGKQNPPSDSQVKDNSEKGKILVHQIDLAEDTDFCAVTVEVVKPLTSSSEGAVPNREIFVELYRLPKEQWLKELETLHKKHGNDGGSLRNMARDNESDDLSSQLNKEDGKEEDTFTMGSIGDDRTSNKFGPPILCYKYRPNMRRVNPVSNSVTIPNYVKALNTTCDVLGSGVNHLYTSHHLQQRRDLFEYGRRNMREQYKRYLATDSAVDPLFLPIIHFLKNGPLLPVGMEDQTAGIAMWWESHNQLKFYSLTKAQATTSSNKDVEPKVDVLWTFGSSITSSAMSHCGSLLAVGLHSGNLTVFDYAYGLQRMVQHVSDFPLTQLNFLVPNQSILTKSTLSMDRESDSSTERSQAYLIAVDNTFHYYLQDCGVAIGRACKSPQPIKTSIKYPSEATAWIQYIPNLPTMMLRVTQSGQIVLHDVSRKEEVVEFRLPLSYALWQPWQPCICVAGNGQTLCAKVMLSSEDASNGENKTRLIFFPLRHMSLLKSYWNQEEIPMESVKLSNRMQLEQRAALFLKQRNSSFIQRQEEIRNSWRNAKQTFLNIMKEKELKERIVVQTH